MKTLVKNTLVTAIIGTGSSLALAQDLGPVATGLATAMQTADPVNVDTGAVRSFNESHSGTQYSIEDLLRAVSEDISAELETFMSQRLASGDREAAPTEPQVVSTY